MEVLHRDIELYERYFGVIRVGVKRWRGVYGKTILFGLLKRGNKVYTEIVPDCKINALVLIIAIMSLLISKLTLTV